ncbi:cobalt ECF transporter T component CbiQ [Marinobacterium jannaschii]|uniref:cobalt ECF transporter T component CbiQ n=1 Tax=Marinobacterium jannaschii TaxID=64970 RepID=UPI000687D851|nr:cobalt ECF transporter T component CbiQ [Marinobacterium jannaschii]
MPKFLEHSTVSWKGQQLKHPSSAIDRLDPRLRAVLTFLFALLVVSCQHYPALISALLVSLVTAMIARVDRKRTLRRVLAMDLFMIFLLILLPFSVPGDSFLTLAGLSASWQGLHQALVIILKANAVILMLLTLVGTMDASTLGHALARLKVPEKLVHLMLFTVRYLDVINREYKRMRMAMRARSFVARSDLHTWRTFGYLFGMLLVRSLERSERIMMAMKCRGFKGQLYLLDEIHWRRQDSFCCLLATAILAIIAGLELNSPLLLSNGG